MFITHDYEGSLRLIVVKDKRLKQVKLKNEKGTRYLRDETNNIVTQQIWEPVHYTYLTNIPSHQLTKESILMTYKTRWCVEDLFEELKNDWGLKYFPSTNYNTIQAHIYFLFILYTVVNLFKQLILKDKFSLKMLGSLQISVFQAHHSRFARWLQNLNEIFSNGKTMIATTYQLLNQLGHYRLLGASP